MVLRNLMHKNMPSNKTPPDRIGEISALLQLGWSFWAIKNHLKKQGKSVSNGLISKIKNGGFAVPSARKKRGRPKRKLSHAQVARLKRLVLKVHPPTQNDLRRRFNCSRGCIQRAIKRMNECPACEKAEMSLAIGCNDRKETPPFLAALPPTEEEPMA